MSNLLAFDGAVQAWLDELAGLRRLSPHTVQAYGADLSRFLEALEGEGVERLDAVRPDHVLQHLRERSSEGLGPRSMARALASIRAFFRWAEERERIEGNPCDGLAAPRHPKPLPDVLSAIEIEDLLAAPDTERPVGQRDKAFLELLYGSGLRVSELCRLRLEDIYPDDEVLRVFGKGGKERVVPLGSQAMGALEGWLRVGRRAVLKGRSSPWVFPGRGEKPISRQALWLRMQAYGLEVGIRGSLHPHRLRHSFATHLVEAGADLRVVQTLLGHADIGTTEIYTQIAQDHLRQVIRDAHPRGRRQSD